MARQRTLTTPMTETTVSPGGTVAHSYDIVRFRDITFSIQGTFLEQRATFAWDVGKIVDGVFIKSGIFCGVKEYTNIDNAFATLIAASNTIAALQDNVLADLQTANKIGDGVDSDYSMS